MRKTAAWKEKTMPIRSMTATKKEEEKEYEQLGSDKEEREDKRGGGRLGK